MSLESSIKPAQRGPRTPRSTSSHDGMTGLPLRVRLGAAGVAGAGSAAASGSAARSPPRRGLRRAGGLDGGGRDGGGRVDRCRLHRRRQGRVPRLGCRSRPGRSQSVPPEAGHSVPRRRVRPERVRRAPGLPRRSAEAPRSSPARPAPRREAGAGASGAVGAADVAARGVRGRRGSLGRGDRGRGGLGRSGGGPAGRLLVDRVHRGLGPGRGHRDVAAVRGGRQAPKASAAGARRCG